MPNAPIPVWSVTEPEIMELPIHLDGDTGADIEEDARLCIESGARELILDCVVLDTVTAAGLRSILAIAQNLQKVGGKIALCNLEGQPKTMFEACGLDAWIPAYGDDNLSQVQAVA
jgi:anti-anti-sigma factor